MIPLLGAILDAVGLYLRSDRLGGRLLGDSGTAAKAVWSAHRNWTGVRTQVAGH